VTVAHSVVITKQQVLKASTPTRDAFHGLMNLCCPGIDEPVLLSGLDELVLLSALDELVLLSGHDEPVLLSVQALAVPEVVPTNKNVLELNRQKKRCGQK